MAPKDQEFFLEKNGFLKWFFSDMADLQFVT